MRLVSFLTVAAAAALACACVSCGEESGTKLQEEFMSGKFDQEKSLAALESTLEYKRQVAAEFLAKLGDEKVVAPLAKHMHTDTSIKVRKICLNGLLERYKNKKDNSIVPEFIKALQEQQDTNLRQKAVFALGELQTDDGYKTLLEMLKDKAPEVRKTAVEALAKFKKTEALKELGKLYEDEDVSVRREAVDTIAKIGGPDAVELLIPALANSDFAVKKTAIVKLGEMKARKAAPDIIPLLKADNASIREVAAIALGNIRERAAVGPLCELFTDENLDVRRAAVEAAGKIGGIEVVDALIPLLDDGDNLVREFALDALVKRKIQGNEALKAKLRYMAQSDPYTTLREKAKEALEKIK